MAELPPFFVALLLQRQVCVCIGNPAQTTGAAIAVPPGLREMPRDWGSCAERRIRRLPHY